MRSLVRREAPGLASVYSLMAPAVDPSRRQVDPEEMISAYAAQMMAWQPSRTMALADNPLEAYLPPDGWVAYHGTSSVFADRIEAEGLSPENGVWTAEDCRAVCEVFEKLQWFGLSNGGFVVLRPWGPDRDVPMTGQQAHLPCRVLLRCRRLPARPRR